MVGSRTLGGLSQFEGDADEAECYELIIINARRRVARPCLAGHVSAQKHWALHQENPQMKIMHKCSAFSVSDAKKCIMRLIIRIFRIFRIPRVHRNGLENSAKLDTIRKILAYRLQNFGLNITQYSMI